MNFVDIILIVAIILILNIFVHSLANTLYKDFQYNQKIQNTIILLVILGMVSIVASYYINNDIISWGLFYGGILLIISAIFGSWDQMGDTIKLVILAGIFGIIVWYSFTKS